MNTSQRLQRIQERIVRRGLDSLLVSKLPNIRYLSGFSGSEAVMLITREQALLITDFRYIEQAQEECKGLEIVERKGPLLRVLVSQIRQHGLRKLGFEAEALSFDQYSQLSKALARRRTLPVKGLVEDMRETKDAEEVGRIRGAIKIAEEAFKRLRRRLKSGLSERQVAARLDFSMQEAGADGPAFNTIVALGERASLPHAPLTDRRAREKDSLLVDWGARRKSYNSDLTRVVFLNKITPQARKIYSIVLEAQSRAIEKVRAGVGAREVDQAARGYIERKGYGKNFGHGLGHGIGLEVHEGPRLNRINRRPLREGMVVTVEPGIYIPHWGGIRIEDMVLVKKDGFEVLSHIPKGLDEVII